jgi:hypothetical protein
MSKIVNSFNVHILSQCDDRIQLISKKVCQYQAPGKSKHWNHKKKRRMKSTYFLQVRPRLVETVTGRAHII